MIEGLWIVQFEGIADSGGGVIVLVGGKALGGDSGFVYAGTYLIEGTALSARVLVRNFNPAVNNALGVQGNFELAIRGTIQGETIKGSASLIQQEGPGLVIKLTKVAELPA